MKKTAFLLLALLLVIPALSNAASVTSRYDVTFGGFVKYDLGYSTQNTHADPATAFRGSSSDRTVLADEYAIPSPPAERPVSTFSSRAPISGAPGQVPSSKATSAA